jgi:hypothetical protein
VEVAEVVVEEVLREVAVVGGANLALGEVLESSLYVLGQAFRRAQSHCQSLTYINLLLCRSLTAIPASSLLEVEGKTCSSRRT